MNTRLLKKIRKRYKYHFEDRGFFGSKRVCMLDMKSKRIKHFYSVEEFIRDYVFEHMGFWTGTEYVRRKYKIMHLNRFREQLKKVIKP